MIRYAMEGIEDHQELQATAVGSSFSNGLCLGDRGKSILKPLAPTLRQLLQLRPSPQQFDIRIRRPVEHVGFEDGKGGLCSTEKLKFIARPDFAFLDYREIEAAPAAAEELLDHVFALKFRGQL